jgi:hypothetical protein
MAAVRTLRGDDCSTVRNLLQETAVVCGLINRCATEENLAVAQGWGWYTNGARQHEVQRKGRGGTSGDIAS